jgi:hypothetical protein
MRKNQLASLVALLSFATPSPAFDFRDDKPSAFFYVEIPLDARTRKQEVANFGFAVQGREYRAFNFDTRILNALEAAGITSEAQWILGGAAVLLLLASSGKRGSSGSTTTTQTADSGSAPPGGDIFFPPIDGGGGTGGGGTGGGGTGGGGTGGGGTGGGGTGGGGTGGGGTDGGGNVILTGTIRR